MSWRDSATPKSKAKPDGIHGCQIWAFVGPTQPADPSGYTFLATETKSFSLQQYLTVSAGQTVWFLLRWESNTGKTGPWSDVVSAKIPA